MLQHMLLSSGSVLPSQMLSLACPAVMALKPSLTLAAKPEGLFTSCPLQQLARRLGTCTAAADAASQTRSAATAANSASSSSGGGSYEQGYVAPLPGMSKIPAGTSIQHTVPADVVAAMWHPVYPREYLESIKPKHLEPKELHQKLAFKTIQAIRCMFDLATGYSLTDMTPSKWLRRIIFLETVAGVPGMRDNGWINTLLEEAENERMHLLTFMEMRKPGWFFRGSVIIAQGVMFNMMFASYLVSPKFCHALVGYLEEEAVKTYTHALKDIDTGKLWPNTSAPDIAKSYWRLPENATMRDLILVVRADEACHSHMNHTFARLRQDETNPFAKDSHMLP